MRCDKCGSLALHPLTTMFNYTGDMLSSLESLGETFVTVTFLCNNCQAFKTIKYLPESSEL